MALSIKNRETEALARELAQVTRKPITKAVHDALAREVNRVKEIAKISPRQGIAQLLMEIGKRASARPLLDPRPVDEILYDEHGLPK